MTDNSARTPGRAAAGTGNGTDHASGTGNGGLRIVAYAAQFFFGGWFLLHGLNHWMHFFPQPPGSSPIASQLIGALIASGLFTLVKALEVITGLMLLANRWVPLAIVLAFPIGISIAYLDYAANPDWFGTITAIAIMVLLAIMALSHLRRFMPMLVFDQGEPDLGSLRTILKRQGSE